MKTATKLAMISIGLLLPTALHAMDTGESAYLAKVKKGPGIPVPVSVTAPEGHFADEGDSAEVVLVVDATGKPTSVTVKSTTDRSLGLAAREAVKQWRFEPAMVDGKPTAVKVLVPFRVGKSPATEAPTFAATR